MMDVKNGLFQPICFYSVTSATHGNSMQAQDSKVKPWFDQADSNILNLDQTLPTNCRLYSWHASINSSVLTCTLAGS